MSTRPLESEAAKNYFAYIDRIASDDVVSVLEDQINEGLDFFAGIPEEASLARYAEDKWSMREMLNHINDTERMFAFRALWFARGLSSPLPGFDQDAAAAASEANGMPWAAHVEEFRRVRLATVSLFAALPPEAWMRRGTADGNPFTVRAIGYVIAGHFAHHLTLLRERYL